MQIDSARLPAIVRALHEGPLSIGDADTVVGIAQLAIDADGREDPDEIGMFFAFGKAVLALAGVDATPAPTVSGDEEDERIAELVGKLSNTAARELAYTMSYVLTIADLDAAPEESQFMEKLRARLQISSERANDLAQRVAEAITPS
jgi:hypothetical protein